MYQRYFVILAGASPVSEIQVVVLYPFTWGRLLRLPLGIKVDGVIIGMASEVREDGIVEEPRTAV